MEAMDFSRSFLTFRIDTRARPPRTVTHKPPYSLNNARIQIECCCRITEKASGRDHTFYLGASCKTERVGVERDVWTEPNADFAPIFSDTHFLTLKTYARVGIQVPLYKSAGKTGPPQPDRQLGSIEESFDNVRRDITHCPGRLLASAEEIVDRVLANRPLVARTHLENQTYLATLDYPVKTINANERDMIYQTDTGPVLLPDLSVAPAELLATMQLAFAAFNSPSWTEFLVRAATPVAGDLQVYHYSLPVRHAARNELVELL